MIRFLSASFFCFVAASFTGCGSVAPLPAADPSVRWSVPAASAPRAELGAASQADNSKPPRSRIDYFQVDARDTGPGARPGKPVSAGKQFQLDFHDAEIKSVVDAVLGDILKINYVVSPQVQGRITLRTGRPIERDALLSALEAALASVSVALVAQDGGYQVMPMDAAPQRVRGAYRASADQRGMPGFAIEVIPLRYISAKEMLRILEVFAQKGSVIQADDTYNQVVIVGTSADRAAMVRTIESFDTDGMKGMTFGFFRLEHVSADKLITELKSVFQPPIELIGSRVRLVPMERIQTILGIAPNRSDLEVVETWIRRLDVSDNTGEQKLFVYNVQNGSAKEIAASLQSVMMSGDYGASARQVPMARTAAAPRSDGTLTRSDSTSTTTDGRPEVARVGQSRIVASEENNSLLIFGTERDYRVLREALAKLDILPRQVLIEAILAEVTLGDDLRYGVQWFFDSAVSRTTLTPDESGAVGSSFPGFSYLYSGLTNARVVINALQSRTNVNVLSAPRLAVLNNQKASLQVGDQVPIRTQVSQGTAAAGAPVVSTIQMQDTGVILDVTPRVNDNGNVILDVTQEVSDVTTTTSSSIDSPTIQRRRLRSVIATRDGATVALGGLIRENKSRGRSGVPLLQDIPWVGNLFSASNITTRRTELIVLLVPHVMRDAAETQVVVDALINGAKSAAEVASHATPLVQKPQD